MAEQTFLDSDIEFLKGLDPWGAALRKELGVKCARDLLFQFPFRYIDKTQFQSTSRCQDRRRRGLAQGHTYLHWKSKEKPIVPDWLPV